MARRPRALETLVIEASFWRGRRVLITGHSGFKGSWLSLWLLRLGADVSGVALPPSTQPNLFSLVRLAERMRSRYLDVRDRAALFAGVHDADPEIVFHLSSQPIVQRSIEDPQETFTTNVIGLVNLLDAVRECPEPPVVINVTSDKVYRNDDATRAFRESDPLGGDDPYSASKACAELVTTAYRRTFAGARPLRLCTARAGNVIGGGDWAVDRLIPDLVRAAEAGRVPVLRDPEATRPWQHVLDASAGYLSLAQHLCTKPGANEGAWNFGPAETQTPTVAAVAECFLARLGAPTRWSRSAEPRGIERHSLRLDATMARAQLGWDTRYTITQAVEAAAQWYRARRDGADPVVLTDAEIAAYEAR